MKHASKSCQRIKMNTTDGQVLYGGQEQGQIRGPGQGQAIGQGQGQGQWQNQKLLFIQIIRWNNSAFSICIQAIGKVDRFAGKNYFVQKNTKKRLKSWKTFWIGRLWRVEAKPMTPSQLLGPPPLLVYNSSN